MDGDKNLIGKITEYLKNIDPECESALLNPILINSTSSKINETKSSVTSCTLYCDNLDNILPNVRKQLNIVLPLSIRKSKNYYTVNLIKDINIYRKFYEKQAKEINVVIEETRKQIKQLCEPFLRLKKKLDLYFADFKKSLESITIPLKNKRDALNDIDYSSYTEENQKLFLEDKEKVKNEVNEFLKLSNDYFEHYSKLNEKNIDEIKTSIIKFKDLAKPSQELSGFITKAFLGFENAISGFSDLDNKEKVDKSLKKIKKPIDDGFPKPPPIEPPKQNIDTESYEDIKKKMDEVCEEMKNKSEEIKNKIMEIREKYGEQQKILQNSVFSKPLDIAKEAQSIKQDITEAKTNINEAQKKQEEGLEKDVKKVNDQARFDLLFIMDATSSMDVYLDQVKKDILSIIADIQNNCPGISLYIGFIGYRDFNDLDLGDQYLDIDFTDKYDSIIKDIEYIEADGGGDTPEDLCGAFEMAKNKSWGGNSKFEILVTDSPCHGKKYHDLDGEQKDNYPEGDRKTRNIEDYVTFFAQNEVNVYCLKITDLTDKMFGIFKEIYEKNKPQNTESQFCVEESRNKIKDIVTKKVKEIFVRRKKVEFEDNK